MRSRTWWPVCAGALLLCLAGCNNSEPADSYTAPGAVAPPPPSAAPSSPALPAARPPTGPPPVGRPMTAWEKQYREQCHTGVVKNGCELYTDSSLRLQGVNPDS
jgi:hypothetical protein